jgi:beta-galactosidase
MPGRVAGNPGSGQGWRAGPRIAALLFAGLSFAAWASVATRASAASAPAPAKQILYGAAYYEEYAPYDRLDADIAMMKAAHINVVRIGESTWGTMEPAPGVFDFSHIDRVLRAMEKAGINVIVGTPTYAIPTWLARQHPDVLVSTSKGKAPYGPRQNMDITHPEFLAAAERTIRAMITHVKDSPAVIGYQLDNETKAYDVSGPRAQAGFVAAMRSRFGSLDALNKAFGLDYWSNRINAWEDFPSTDGSINASLTSAYAQYQRSLVTDYLAWQAGIVRQLKRPDQFLTQNFDMDWRGYSYGIQPAVDHFAAARVLDVAGIDIYHKTQDDLTGTEIAFGGDLARSMKGGRNYLVIETQAQGFPDWTPYPGQLRLQAFSHLASGANMVGYWHWGTTSNAIETYWRGLLAQDYLPNPTYTEAATIGADLARLGPKLVDLQKHNRVAVYFSNRALTAYDAFRFGGSYNDVLRPFYDALYRMNVETDFIDPSVQDLSAYKLIVVPALYAASDSELRRLADFARNGGHLVVTYRSGFSDENVKVRAGRQPGLLADLVGATYSQFTIPKGVTLRGDLPGLAGGDGAVRWWMELLVPTTATVIARYDHPAWRDYAAITRNAYGKGEVTYVGCMPSDAIVSALLGQVIERAGLKGPAQALRWPIVARSGVNAQAHVIHYLLNYSARPEVVAYPFASGTELLAGSPVATGSTLALQPWGVAIIEEER